MDFNQVKYFLALKDTLNFTRAAERCGVSQPALTQSIRRLETELGGRLVKRSGGQSKLTALGEILYDQFRQLDVTRQLVEATAHSVTSGDQATLNIGVMCTLGHEQIAPFLDTFIKRHPNISIVLHSLSVDQITCMITTGAVDGAFCSTANKMAGRVRYLPLYKERMAVAFRRGHRFAEFDEVTLDVVTEEPYVDRLHCEFRTRFFEFIDAQRLKLQVAASSEREDWIQGLIRYGVGVSVIPEYTATAPEIDLRPIADDLHRKIEFALLKSATLAPALVNFVNGLESHAWQGLTDC